MSNLISTTSGSKSILINIIKKNPEHHLSLYKSSLENTFVLIDWLPNAVIFKAPVTYQFLEHSKPIKTGPFINLFYFTLSSKEKNILKAYVNKQLVTGLPKNMSSLFLAQDVKNSAQVMVGTSWSNVQTCLKWLQTSFIHSFIQDHSNDGFHNNLIQL